MMQFEKLIRLSPKIFVFAAGLDLVKQLQWLFPFWLRYHEQAFTSADYEFNNAKYTVDLVDRLLSVVLFPLGWIATAIVITLLLATYDQRKAQASDAAE